MVGRGTVCRSLMEPVCRGGVIEEEVRGGSCWSLGMSKRTSPVRDGAHRAARATLYALAEGACSGLLGSGG